MLERIEIHLLYAMIVWVAAWLLTSMKRGTATTKYWIWVATSLNFILPLSIVPDRLWPSVVGWFDPRVAAISGSRISPNASITLALWIVWSLGAAVMVTRLSLQIRTGRRGAHASDRGPAVVGLLRPRITLPPGIERLLTDHELNAVLIHELTHAKRRDNLIRLIHEVTLCALWFHPFVWITGSRLALYRELSCDESVTRRASGGDLVSALAKLANPEHALLLEATASSFMRHRLALLTASQAERQHRTANAMLSAMFGAILIAAVIGPAAQAAARYACALTHAPHGGVQGGIRGGIAGGVRGGIKGGVRGGIL
jgi:hypothetical protein